MKNIVKISGHSLLTHHIIRYLPRILAGIALIFLPEYAPPLRNNGWEPLGAVLGILFVVFSLFGDLPVWFAWTQRIGEWLTPGIAAGTVLLLIQWLLPLSGNSAVYAFSPVVWLAYISIVLVSISFEHSSLPVRIYHSIKRQALSPAVVIPIFIVVVGLLGNLFDGVTIIAISVVIFLALLPEAPAQEASFAMLFGGLISNMITVAAEPTNIKFQDALGPLLDAAHPSYWFANWPISVFGVIFPAVYLAIRFQSQHVTWLVKAASQKFAGTVIESAKSETPNDEMFAEQMLQEDEIVFNAQTIEKQPDTTPQQKQEDILLAKTLEPAKEKTLHRMMAIAALILLAGGIFFHSVIEAAHIYRPGGGDYPLWIFIAPAGIAALIHLLYTKQLNRGWLHIKNELPVWGRLMVIFSLIWFLSNKLSAPSNVFAGFYALPEQARYGLQIILSLLSSLTDNVAIAGMQGAMIINHPIALWQIRLLFILLTWAGGLTYFGCLQSLALNARLHLPSSAWFKAAIPWAIISFIGGIIGLACIIILYPH